jgi:hypothetical protein
MYDTAQGAVWSNFWLSVLVIFFKVLFLMHLILVILEFEIIETISLAA